MALHWRHNDHDGVLNHQPHGCLLNRLFRRRSKKTSKLRVTGLCVGNSPGPVNSPHKGPVTRKMVPFDDVIMDRRQDDYATLLLLRPEYFGITRPILSLLIPFLRHHVGYWHPLSSPCWIMWSLSSVIKDFNDTRNLSVEMIGPWAILKM